MTGRNFENLRKEQAISRYGYEPRAGGNLIPTKIRKKKKNKDKLRADVASIPVDTMMTKVVSCRHGHRRKIRITIAESAGPFSCAECSEVAR
ncbi:MULTISPECIES: hypothetical protein [unclassified Agrobacterium]|uniref:hypothetical protein n=1 Tax=unclassified Agrobacterium TaxID=2632611 RepID=UPI000308634B|nr:MULTISPECIES: hypothetical protein [unclassified Agrobacterium]QKW97307.1 hypothetical protein GSF67_09510 [Agrobacterium sp. CGMCC 11546]